MFRYKSFCAAALPTAMVMLAISVQASAQDVPTEPVAASARIEEVVVISRKREENLQSVPISISAFTNEDINIRDIYNLERLADQTPGLSFATAGSIVNRRPVIRGFVQQTRVGDEPSVATFIDGIYTPGFSGAEFFSFGSLERVEVLKGPQSALYGRNSFAGAINYVTAKPTYDLQYGGQATIGQSEREGYSGYVSGPLINDTLAMRLDMGYNQTGGTNKNSLDGKALGSNQTNFVRWGTKWDPSDRASFNLSLSYQEDETNATPVTIVADDDPNRVGTKMLFAYSPFEGAAGGGSPIGRVYSGAIKDTSERYEIDTRSFAGKREIFRSGLTFNYDFDVFELVSTTGYQTREVETLSDFNTCRNDVRSAVCDTVSTTATGTFFGPSPILANAPLIGGVLTGSIEDRDEFSQDLRLQSSTDGRLRWSTGIYYSTEDFRDQTQRLSDVNLGTPSGIIYAVASSEPLIDATTNISNQFYSAYGSLDYDISAQWNVVAEGRYTKESKKADQVENNFPTNVPPTGNQERDFDYFTPRFILTYVPTDDLLVYGSAAKGVKSGGFNPGSVSMPSYNEEKNWTYELGAKYTFLSGKARLNAAVYSVDWDNQQVTATDPDNTRLPITTNVAKTEILGGEIEGFYVPTDWLQFNLGFAYIDAEYKEGQSTETGFLTDCENLDIPCDQPGIGGFVTSGDLAGLTPPGTPEKSVNAGMQVDWPLFQSSWDFQGRLDYSWQDQVFIDDANSGFIPSRQTVNLRLGVQDEHWSVAGFCNNLGNDDTPIFALPPRDILGVPHYAVINRDERMCGMQVSFRS